MPSSYCPCHEIDSSCTKLTNEAVGDINNVLLTRLRTGLEQPNWGVHSSRSTRKKKLSLSSIKIIWTKLISARHVVWDDSIWAAAHLWFRPQQTHKTFLFITFPILHIQSTVFPLIKYLMVASWSDYSSLNSDIINCRPIYLFIVVDKILKKYTRTKTC